MLYGSVSGYFAEGIALVSKPPLRNQMEQALRKQGEIRAVAVGKAPATGADGLFYVVPYSAERPYRWDHGGRVENIK